MFSTHRNLAQGQKEGERDKKVGITFENLSRIPLIIFSPLISFCPSRKAKVSCENFVLQSILHIFATKQSLKSPHRCLLDSFSYPWKPPVCSETKYPNLHIKCVLFMINSLQDRWCGMYCDGQLGYLSQK